MIKLLDKNELAASTQGLNPIDTLVFGDKRIAVYVYEASSLVFDLREMTWEQCRECGIIITGHKIVKALDTLYYDSIRYVMKDIQKDLANLYGSAADELEEDVIGEGKLEEDDNEEA